MQHDRHLLVLISEISGVHIMCFTFCLQNLNITEMLEAVRMSAERNLQSETAWQVDSGNLYIVLLYL